jgi:hypothetical protein
LTTENLRGKVFGRATKGVGAVAVLHVHLAQTEIAQRNMAGVIKQDVLWLEVAVDDVERVKVLECEEKLGSIEARAILAEPLLLLQVMEQLSSVDEPE